MLKNSREKKIFTIFEIILMSNQFDPILESLAIFLEFQYCGIVSQLNKIYNIKTWVYILTNTNRKIQQPILVNRQSIAWILKHRLFLKYQHLTIQNNFQVDLSTCSEVRHVSIFNPNTIVILPSKIKHLTLFQFYGNIQNIVGLETLEIYGDTTYIAYVLSVHCKTLKNIKIASQTVKLSLLPICPNVETFVCHFTLEDITNLLTIFPKLTTLTIKFPMMKNFNQLAFFPFRLILVGFLADNQCFGDFKCYELDLRNCMHAEDYCCTNHIPIVKKYIQCV